MKRFLAAIAALVIASTAADAATYHVRPGGNNSNAGGTYAAAWQTIGKANTAARPGDLIYVYNGTYAHFPNPDSAGSNPTGGGRITFVGANLSLDPLTSRSARDLIVLPSGTSLSKSYVTIAGMKMPGLTLAEAARWDSVRTCTINGYFSVEGDYNVVSLCDVEGDHVSIGATAARTAGNIIENSAFPNLGKNVVGNPASLWRVGNGAQSGCGGSAGETHMTDSLTLNRLVRTITVESGLIDAHPVVFYRSQNVWQNYCRTVITSLSTRGSSAGNSARYIYRLRDSTQNVHFNCDTVLVSGSEAFRMWMNSNGNNACSGRFASVSSVTVDSSLWNAIDATDSDLMWDESMNNFTATYSTFVFHRIWADYLRGRSVFDHNLLAGYGWRDNHVYAGVFNITKSTWPSMSDTALSFSNNIVYNFGAAPGPEPFKYYSSNPGSYGCAVLWDILMVDSTRALGNPYQNNLVSDNNLFSYYGYVATPGDRNLATLLTDKAYSLYSAPGDSSATNPAGRWENRLHTDSLSVYGSPLFRDSTDAITFDPTPMFGSAVAGAGSGGSDIGPVAISVGPKLSFWPDVVVFEHGHEDSAYVYFMNNGDDAGLLDFDGTPINGVSVSSGTGLTFPSDLESIGAGSDPFPVVIYYDGIGPPALRQWVFGTNDPFNLLTPVKGGGGTISAGRPLPVVSPTSPYPDNPIIILVLITATNKNSDE